MPEVDPYLKIVKKIDKCNINNTTKTDYSCFSNEDIMLLVNTYNDTFCKNNMSQCYKQKLITLRNKQGKKRSIKSLYKILKNKLSKFNKKYKNEYTWLKIDEFKSKFINRNNIFIKKMPTEWCSNIKKWREQVVEAPWLSNYDIDDVIIQYETKYKNFKFLGSTPIDIRHKLHGTCVLNIFSYDTERSNWLDSNSLNKKYCTFKPDLYKNADCFGIVFNTDNHRGGGKHWMGLYFNLKQKCILFFDSALTYPSLHKEIKEFVKDIKKQYSDIDFTFKYNSVQHQQSNSECGMFSIYFILTMVDADNSKNSSMNSIEMFDKYFNNDDGTRISDKLMLLYRSNFFLETCDRR